MLPDIEAEIAADDLLKRQARAAARRDAVLGSPEARDRQLTAFALVLRFDISAEHAVLYLRQAPPLATVDEVRAWVEAIPIQSAQGARQ